MKETSLNGKTPDIGEENIKKLKQIFPDVFTEDKVDFEKLQQVLGNYVEDSDERYNFTWNGKGKALRLSQTPSLGTLRPCKEESKDWDTTQNLYIEGDNLEVLKLLQKSYHGKIKMIYIDPPYNTGTDIIYKNNYHNSLDYYKKFTGQINEEGFLKTTNTETSGRYHTDWLNMMYPRLRLARNLLSDDGIIVISIDDYEVHNLRKVLDEVFGEANLIGTIITRCNPQGRGKNNVDPIHEYNFIYSKDFNELENLKIERELEEGSYNYLQRSGTNSRKHERPHRYYPMLVKEDEVYCISKEEYNTIYEEGKFNEDNIKKINKKYEKLGYKVIYPIASDGEEKVWQRKFDRVLREHKSYIYNGRQIMTPSLPYRTPQSLWLDEKYSNSGSGTNVLIDLFDGLKPFDFPKSFKTVEDFISLQLNNDDNDFIVLDFFAGSSTTAHSVMELNAIKNRNLRYIMVQLPESLIEIYNNSNKDRKKELEKVLDFLEKENRNLNLAEIGKERIRRAGDKIKEENKDKENIEDLDIGFKVLKLDTSNIRKWQPDQDNLEQSLLDYVDHYVEGRTDLDIVYEIMLKYGLDMTYPVEEFTISGKNVYSIGFGMLMICLDNEITTDIAQCILDKVKELGPESSRVVFRDNGFKTDSNKTNIKEILKVGGIEEFITL